MTSKEIVKRLREWGSGLHDIDEAVDLIERQAKALSECQGHLAELFDNLHGTPCEQIRHAQEVEELKRALKEAERALEPVDENGPTKGRSISLGQRDAMRAALATIRAVRGEKR